MRTLIVLAVGAILLNPQRSSGPPPAVAECAPAASAAFLAKLDLARCYDLAWRLEEVEPAIRDALAAFGSESRPPQGPTSSQIPLAGRDVPIPGRITFEPPKYPDQAASDGITGLVIVEAVIDREGKVQKVEVAKSVRHLDRAAIDAVKKWRYAPVVVNGRVIEVVTYLPIKFGQAPGFWSSDVLELTRFYYERGMWGHVAASLETARQTARKDAERIGRVYATARGSGTPGNFKWPTVVTQFKPRYTQAAMREKIQGQVELDVLIDRSGDVVRAKVTKPLKMLTVQAELAAMQWKFAPGTLDGEPVSVKANLMLEFRLH